MHVQPPASRLHGPVGQSSLTSYNNQQFYGETCAIVRYDCQHQGACARPSMLRTPSRCRDLQGYVVLCGVSTCGSLVTTVLSLVVPQSFWQRLQADGVLSVWKQVLLGLSRYGQAAARRCRISVAPQQRVCTASQQVPPAEVVAPQMSTHVHRRSGRGSVSGGACDVAVAMLVAPEAAPEPL